MLLTGKVTNGTPGLMLVGMYMVGTILVAIIGHKDYFEALFFENQIGHSASKCRRQQ